MADRERIVPLKRTSWDYIEARRMAAQRGMKLPSNVLHDEYLVRSGDWEQVKEIYPAWARELLVYPRIGRKFTNGRDVIDSEEDHQGRRWVLPAEYLRKAHERGEVYGIADAGLLLEPGDFEEKNWRVIVHPSIITILHNVVGLVSMGGKMNEITGLPERMQPGQRIPPGMKRRLFRNEGAGVRPIIRGVFGRYTDVRHNIIAGDGWPMLYEDQRDDIHNPRFKGFGVSGVATEKVQFAVLRKGNRLIIEGTPDMLEAALRELQGWK
ncbi:hypothetical protein L0Y65_06650 [Candidatus Micrarchaeota archaeon]|nr:hypothetical protein [Candidatus Micrarchaeota archaeon]